MEITDTDITQRIVETELEALSLTDENINRRRALTAETMVLRDYRQLILKSPNRIAFLEDHMKTQADRGNLNYAAGVQRVIKWIQSWS